LADTRDLPDGRSQAGDRHLKIHDERDNLGRSVSTLGEETIHPGF
jgi:hypothetical protein